MSGVSFTESLIDSAVAVTLDSLQSRSVELDEAIKYVLVFFGEGMFLRSWLRIKMDSLQTEKIIKDIAASSVSKSIGLGIYAWFQDEDVDFTIIKKAIMVSVGTGVAKYFFTF